MEIKRFEALTGRWNPGDKIIKGTLHWDFEIYKDGDMERYINEYDDLESAIHVYLQDHISNIIFDYKLVDYQDNEIEDEELFDSTNRYNV